VKGHVYTDGSWTDDTTLADTVAGRSQSRAVYYNKGINELAVRIVDTQGRMESAYSAELLAGFMHTLPLRTARYTLIALLRFASYDVG
jgi:hypothetical protein